MTKLIGTLAILQIVFIILFTGIVVGVKYTYKSPLRKTNYYIELLNPKGEIVVSGRDNKTDTISIDSLQSYIDKDNL